MRDSSSPIASDLKILAAGTVMTFGGAVLGNGLTYLYGLLMGRFLGAESVGLYSLALIIMQLMSCLCRGGLPDGFLRFLAIHVGEGDLARVKGTIFFSVSVVTAVSALVSLLLFVLAEPVSIDIFKQPGLVPYVRWISAILPFFTVLILVLNAIQALKRMDLVVISRDFIQPIIMLASAFVLFGFIQSPASFLAAHLASMCIALAISMYFLIRMCHDLGNTPSLTFDGWKRLLAFSLPIAGADVTHYLFRWSDTLLLSFFTSPTEVGIYSAASRTTLLLSLLAVSVNALYAPIIADHYHNKRYQRIQVVLRTLLRWCLTLALPVVFAMSLFAEQILFIWGAKFAAGNTALIILATSQLVFIISSLLAFTLVMCGRQYLELANVVFATTMSAVANLVLIPRYGMTGAAISMLFSQAVIFLIRLVEVHHVLGLRLYTSRYFKPFIALLPICLLGIILHEPIANTLSAFLGSPIVGTSIMFVIIAIGYFTCLYFLGIEEEDLSVWRELRTS